MVIRSSIVLLHENLYRIGDMGSSWTKNKRIWYFLFSHSIWLLKYVGGAGVQCIQVMKYLLIFLSQNSINEGLISINLKHTEQKNLILNESFEMRSIRTWMKVWTLIIKSIEELRNWVISYLDSTLVAVEWNCWFWWTSFCILQDV